ncbi:hypothetical protein MalM25_04810 [Planctomycetes bacterium MalM25]|nr:hypothetical protein MalM25_04810 [Planctomycetes bacterium MalM25]
MVTLNLEDESLATQAAAAGYASIEQYVQSLIEQDAERLAIQAGLDAAGGGRTRPFEEFDREFRAKHGLTPRD